MLAAETSGLGAQDVVSNPDFSQAMKFWNRHPENAVSCLESNGRTGWTVSIAPGGSLFQTIKKTVPGGIYNGMIKIRAGKDFEGKVSIHVECFDASGKPIPHSFQRGFTPGNEGKEYRFALILPENTASFRLAANVSGKGNVEVNSFRLECGGTFTGKHSFFSVIPGNDGYEISSPSIGMKLAGSRRLFSVRGISAPEKELVDFATFSMTPGNKKQRDEYYYGGAVENISFEAGASTALLTFECAWEEARFTKTIIFFKDKSYAKLFFELEPLEDFVCSNVTLAFGVNPRLSIQTSKGAVTPSYIRWNGPKWFSIPRPDTERWVAWSDEKNTCGCAVIGADPSSWKEFPVNLLCSARENGGFKLELAKWQKYPARKGDKVSFELFVSVLEGPVAEKASAAAEAITGGISE